MHTKQMNKEKLNYKHVFLYCERQSKDILNNANFNYILGSISKIERFVRVFKNVLRFKNSSNGNKNTKSKLQKTNCKKNIQ